MLQFRFKTIAPDKAITIFSLAIIEVQRMQHAVTIKRMVAPNGMMQGVFCIPQVDTGEIVRQVPDDIQVIGIKLFPIWLPGTASIRVIIVNR